VHWLVDGQATPNICAEPFSISALSRLGPGETGLNVIDQLAGLGAPKP